MAVISLSAVQGLEATAINTERVCSVSAAYLLGGLLSLIVNAIVWPESAKDALRDAIDDALKGVMDCLSNQVHAFLQAPAKFTRSVDTRDNNQHCESQPFDSYLCGCATSLKAVRQAIQCIREARHEQFREMTVARYDPKEFGKVMKNIQRLARHLSSMNAGLQGIRDMAAVANLDVGQHLQPVEGEGTHTETSNPVPVVAPQERETTVFDFDIDGYRGISERASESTQPPVEKEADAMPLIWAFRSYVTTMETALQQVLRCCMMELAIIRKALKEIVQPKSSKPIASLQTLLASPSDLNPCFQSFEGTVHTATSRLQHIARTGIFDSAAEPRNVAVALNLRGERLSWWRRNKWWAEDELFVVCYFTFAVQEFVHTIRNLRKESEELVESLAEGAECQRCKERRGPQLNYEEDRDLENQLGVDSGRDGYDSDGSTVGPPSKFSAGQHDRNQTGSLCTHRPGTRLHLPRIPWGFWRLFRRRQKRELMEREEEEASLMEQHLPESATDHVPWPKNYHVEGRPEHLHHLISKAQSEATSRRFDQVPEAEREKERKMWYRRIVRPIQDFAYLISETVRMYEFRYGVKTCIAALLVAFPAYVDSLSTWYSSVRAYWAIFTIVVVMHATVGDTLHTALYRFLGTTIGAVWALLTWLLSFGSPYVGTQHYTPNIDTQYQDEKNKAQGPDIPYFLHVVRVAVARTGAVSAGILVALLINWSYYPRLARTELRRGCAHVLLDLAAMYGGGICWKHTTGGVGEPVGEDTHSGSACKVDKETPLWHLRRRSCASVSSTSSEEEGLTDVDETASFLRDRSAPAPRLHMIMPKTETTVDQPPGREDQQDLFELPESHGGRALLIQSHLLNLTRILETRSTESEPDIDRPFDFATYIRIVDRLQKILEALEVQRDALRKVWRRCRQEPDIHRDVLVFIKKFEAVRHPLVSTNVSKGIFHFSNRHELI
ncbi:hypothetical protein HK102_014131 [Quaeritorhiza haematococci]|nr:hypothetical protein HK102_014131 [Quaeritorhiza haematococci]